VALALRIAPANHSDPRFTYFWASPYAHDGMVDQLDQRIQEGEAEL
jgi:hypothetical protein